MTFPRAYALALFAPVLFYANAIQGALYEGAQVVEFRSHLYSELNAANAGKWLAAPGMSSLAAVSNNLREQSTLRFAPSPWAEHRTFAKVLFGRWQPYQQMPRRTVFPDDAVGIAIALGFKSYYPPDLEIIDLYGLTDKTVARNPTTKPGRRQIAHERQPPPGYLGQRGVNINVMPAARSAAHALRHACYALKVGPNLWMPFHSDNHQWVAESFADRELRAR